MNLNKLLNCLNTMEDAYQGERDRRAHILAYTEAYEMIMEELSHPVVYTRCVICGDRDFIELEDVVDGPGPLCPSTCGGRAEGCVPCINISGRFNNGDN